MPNPSPARDARDLNEKLGRVIPPAIRHLAAARRERATQRSARQWSLILRNADEAAPGWKEIPVTRLDALNQRRLANLVAVETLGTWYTPRDLAQRPWITHPERGVLRLNGPLGPDQHPMLMFWVPDDRGVELGWGWAVGTAVFAR